MSAWTADHPWKVKLPLEMLFLLDQGRILLLQHLNKWPHYFQFLSFTVNIPYFTFWPTGISFKSHLKYFLSYFNGTGACYSVWSKKKTIVLHVWPWVISSLAWNVLSQHLPFPEALEKLKKYRFSPLFFREEQEGSLVVSGQRSRSLSATPLPQYCIINSHTLKLIDRFRLNPLALCCFALGIWSS